MRKLTKSFQKRQSIASRVLCFLLVLAMVVTMVPALGGGNSTVQAAEKEKNLTIHFMMPSNWGWTTPAIQFWGGIATVTGNTNTESVDGTEIPGWDGAKAFFMTQAGDTTEYTLSVKGTFTGFQFLDFDNTRNNINPGYNSKYHNIRKILRPMFIIFRKMDNGIIIWMQLEQHLFRIYQRQKQLFF